MMTGVTHLAMKSIASLAIVLFACAAASAGVQAAPSMDISSHHDRQTVKDSAIVLSGTASDPAGIAAVTVSLNRGPWKSAELTDQGAGPGGNVSWSVRLELSEGANIIAINATNSANDTTIQNMLIDYSIQQGENGGIILAAGCIIAASVIIALLALRARPPRPRAEDDSAVVKVKAPDEPGK